MKVLVFTLTFALPGELPVNDPADFERHRALCESVAELLHEPALTAGQVGAIIADGTCTIGIPEGENG